MKNHRRSLCLATKLASRALRGQGGVESDERPRATTNANLGAGGGSGGGVVGDPGPLGGAAVSAVRR